MSDAPDTPDLKKAAGQLAQPNRELADTIRRRISAGGKLLALAIAAGIAATILLLANFP